jgi:hypothetical protein
MSDGSALTRRKSISPPHLLLPVKSLGSVVTSVVLVQDERRAGGDEHAASSKIHAEPSPVDPPSWSLLNPLGGLEPRVRGLLLLNVLTILFGSAFTPTSRAGSSPLTRSSQQTWPS